MSLQSIVDLEGVDREGLARAPGRGCETGDGPRVWLKEGEGEGFGCECRRERSAGGLRRWGASEPWERMERRDVSSAPAAARHVISKSAVQQRVRAMGSLQASSWADPKDRSGSARGASARRQHDARIQE